MSPVPYTWAHFRLKFSSKSGFVKLTLYSPPHRFQYYTLLHLRFPYRGVKEGKLKKGSLFAFLGSARAVVGSISKIGQFFEHLNFEKYEPGSLYVGPFSAKIFLKIWFCKIDPLLPPHIDFNTIPYFTYGSPTGG